MRTYKEENSSSMFSTEILQENTAAAFDREHHIHIMISLNLDRLMSAQCCFSSRPLTS